MKKLKLQNKGFAKLRTLPGLVLVAIVASVLAGSSFVLAQSVQDQIEVLQEENAQSRSIVEQLENQALSYQDAISKLQTAINGLQSQIDANTAEQNRLQGEIATAEQELVRQKGLLGENIKAMYLEGQISTLEMLASSKDLSEFVDKEQYRNSVKDKIKTTLDTINALRLQLKTQKEQVEKLLAEQKIQQADLAASRNEQNNLLAYNKGQQSAYNQKVKDNQSKIDALIAAQRRANNIVPDGGFYFIRFPGLAGGFNPGGYPYRDSGFSMSTLPGCGHPDPRTGQRDSTDRWGYCTRQCVSYAAWAVEASGRAAPMNYGSAKNWIQRAPTIYIHRTPQPGDVAISTGGQWGHAMYVEAVNGNQMYISQYNQQLDGEFSYQWRNWR